MDYGLTNEQYESVLKDIDDKLNGMNDFDWSEIVEKHNLPLHPDSLRKQSTGAFGGYARSKYNSKPSAIDDQIKKLREERIMLQTANMERNKLDRYESRKRMYYEYVANTIESLPVPQLNPKNDQVSSEMDYVLVLSDLHYGSSFEVGNNTYNPNIFKERLEYLLCRTEDFVKSHNIRRIHVLLLGDTIQGLIHLTDLRLNDSSVVKATVDVSRYIAQFLNELSAFCDVEYYHVPTANHTQLRVLNSKPNELSSEDLEYVIGHYIADLCKNNPRITPNLVEDGTQYIVLDIQGFSIVAMHGHQIKNIETAIKDITMMRQEFCDYLMLGHYHGGKELVSNEGCTYDCEVLVAPSFVGTDPYANSIMKNSHPAVCIYGFDSVYGHTETHKIILD